MSGVLKSCPVSRKPSLATHNGVMIQALLVIIIGGIHAGNGDKDPLLRTCFKHICIRFRLHGSGNQLHLELSLREKTVKGNKS